MTLPVKGNIKLFGGGRNWLILAFSLLLAFFMWSIMKLSANYSSYVKYRVEVTAGIPGRSNSAQSTDLLVIGAKSTGFNIIQNNGKNANVLLLENVDSRHFHQVEGNEELFYLLPYDIRQTIQDALGADIQVESFATDTLFFTFHVQSNRKVPVVANSIIKYHPQYMPYAPMVLKPDSILIYGDEGIIAGIDHVATETVKSSSTDKSLAGIVKIKPVAGVRLSEDEVFYSQEIGRYVEHTVKVPVEMENAPSYANVVVIPQEVTLKYRVPFAGGKSYGASDFSVTIGYDSILLHDVVKPVLAKMPQDILYAEFSPKFVECVL